jgi:hypothetical protein
MGNHNNGASQCKSMRQRVEVFNAISKTPTDAGAF